MKQKTKIYILLPITAVCLLFSPACRNKSYRPGDSNEPTKQKSYNRIISLAPSTTEILFELGLEEKIIGVSEFCKYPPHAELKPKFGGFLNPNYEAIVAAKPDLVIVFEEMLKPEDKFAAMGIETLAVRHDTIGDILDSIVSIGRYCNRQERAGVMVGEIKIRMEAVRRQCANKPRPRVLISIGHNLSQNTDRVPENIYIAGKDDFYSTMIETAGGQNAYTGTIAFPAVGYESIISMNPQIIIDIVSVEQNKADPQIILKQWRNFSFIDAAKNNRIYIFGDNFLAIPGPRFILTLEKIAHAINPELNI